MSTSNTNAAGQTKPLTEQVSEAASNAYNSVAETVSNVLGSDTGRESFGDKAERKLKPESEKGIGEKISDTASSAYDTAAKNLTPESQKSTSQKISDKASDVKNDLK
ncbi:hypothetical protein PYCC9005_005626 [Savitreella phatthalungensis]